MPTRAGKSWDTPNEDEGPTEAPVQSEGEDVALSTPSSDIQAVLAAIASLQAELSQAKSDICDKIDEKIAVVSTALRSEIAALKAESDAAFVVVNSRLDSQSDALGSLEAHANATSDTVVDLEATVKQLHGQVEQLSEKCLDLEGRSKRQNLRIAGVKEGEENGQKVRDFVAQLLMEVLQLDEKPVIDRAHRALRQRPGDNEATSAPDSQGALLSRAGEHPAKGHGIQKSNISRAANPSLQRLSTNCS